MVLVFGFSFPSFAGFQGNGGFSFGKSGFSFWCQFCLREGVGVCLPPLTFSRVQSLFGNICLVFGYVFAYPLLPTKGPLNLAAK